MRIIASLFAASVLMLAATANAEPDYPKATGYVTDNASIFKSDQHQMLHDKLVAIERDTKSHDQVVVLTTPSLGGQDIKTYSYEVAKKSEIGQKRLDNGILILIALKEHKMRIEVGRRLEPVLTDAASLEIIDTIMKPAFRKGDFYGGTDAAIEEIGKTLRSPEGQPMAPLAAPQEGLSGWAIFFIAVGIFVVVGLVFWFIFGRNREEEEEEDLPLRSYESRREDDDAVMTGAAAGMLGEELRERHQPHHHARGETHNNPTRISEEPTRTRHDDDDTSSVTSSSPSSSSSDDDDSPSSSPSGGDVFSGGGGTFGGGGADGSW